MATRRVSSKAIRMRSGWLRDSIVWVLLFWDRFSVSKTIIPEAQEHFLVSSGPRYTPSFGGLGLNGAHRLLLDSLEPTGEEKAGAEGMGIRAKRGAGKPVRHSLHRTPTQAQRARWEAVQKAKRQGLSLRAIARSWECHGLPPRSTPWRRVLPPNASAPKSVPRRRRSPHRW